MSIKANLIAYGAQALLAALPPDLLVQGADRLLDMVEDLVERSETRVDDAVILPLIRLIREAYHIPDNDPPRISEAQAQAVQP